MRLRLPVLIAISLCAALTARTAFGGFILNGDFSTPGTPPEPFADWTTFDPSSTFDRPADGGGFAVFTEAGAIGSSQLEQQFLLPPDAQTISFEFLLQSVTEGTPVGSPPVPDSFQATLYDLSFNPLLSAGDPFFFPAFYSIDNIGTDPEFFDGTFVSVSDLSGGWRKVTLDVSTLASQELLLEFILNGGPDGRTTTVQLDNVAGVTPSAVVPEPSSLSMLGSGVLALLALYRTRRRHDQCA